MVGVTPSLRSVAIPIACDHALGDKRMLKWQRERKERVMELRNEGEAGRG